MRRFFLLSGCLSALLITACTDGSTFPDPTGKGSVRAINAISTSPTITFLIEERAIGSMAYKTASSKAAYDDFEYIFNFEALLPGDTVNTRIASQTIQVVHKDWLVNELKIILFETVNYLYSLSWGPSLVSMGDG